MDADADRLIRALDPAKEEAIASRLLAALIRHEWDSVEALRARAAVMPSVRPYGWVIAAMSRLERGRLRDGRLFSDSLAQMAPPGSGGSVQWALFPALITGWLIGDSVAAKREVD